MTDSAETTPEDRETGPIENGPLGNDADTNVSDFDAADAKRAAHATEPGMGAEGETDDAPSTVTSDMVDPDQDEVNSYPASKPVPADGEGPLP